MKKISIVLVLSVLFATSGFAQEISSPMVKHLYNGNWPSEKEGQQLRDELYYSQAIQAYTTMLPALNTIGMRDGSHTAFGSGYNVLPIWKERMNSRALVPTPNADIVYAMGFYDLKETGPLVVAVPPGIIGMYTDFFQRTLVDVGAAGPDKAKGGLYLLLPPGYQGHVPPGYYAFESSTYNIFLFFRALMGKGPNGVDPSPGVAVAEKTRIYPLWDEEKNIKPMDFQDGSGKNINMMYPTDYTYWVKLKEFVDHEPIECITPELRGVLAAIGIIKGQAFEPTARQKELLIKAVDRAPKMILATRMIDRQDKKNLYYNDRNWQRIWGGATAEWIQESYLDVTMRSGFFQIGYSSAPAMVMRYINNGSKYPYAIKDSNGEFINGSNTYKIHLPAGIPAKAFWAITLYNISDGTMHATDVSIPGVNGYEDIAKNVDGSIDIYFGPTKPKDVKESNYIKSVEDRAVLVGLRLYGSSVEFFDQTWVPDDVVKIK